MIGLHTDMDERAYRADPCPTPSLNHSVARLILRSPLHGWRGHPRLGGGREEARASGARSMMAIGAAAHKLTLGKGASLVRIDAPDFRSKAAQHARDDAECAGLIAVLKKQYEIAEAMAEEARPVIAAELGDDFHAEAVAIARDEYGSWLRCMCDAITPDLRLILDWKTTESAEPETFAKKIRADYTTQAAFYSHILDLIDPKGAGRRRFVFGVQERECPQAITFHELDPALMEIASKQMERARVKWAACLQSGKWPAYDRGPHIVSPRPWEIDAEMERQYQDDTAQAALEAEEVFS